MELMAPVLGIGLFAFFIWVPMEVLHKAGYSRLWALVLPLTGFLGLIVFALAEWPIHRELAWRRLAMGSNSERDVALTQSYAIKSETRGDWQRAIEVYETLTQRSPDKEEADYAAKCVRRLRESLDQSNLA